MRRHFQRILLLFAAVYLAPDLLAITADAVRTGDLKGSILTHLNVFSLTGMLSFLYPAIAFFLLFHKFYAKNSTLIFILKFILTLVSFICFRYLLEEILMPVFIGYSNYSKHTTLSYYFFDNMLYGLFYGALGVIYYFFQRARTSEHEKQLLLLEKQQAELSFLRSQINPHFLFNSLNNIYALVYHKNEQSLAAIQKLSHLLRYILYAQEERVPIQKELDYIQNYIDLELMRHEKPGLIQLKTELHQQQLTIAPLLLLPFVENAFKHGNLQNAEQPVSIRCKTTKDTLHFSVHNSKAVRQTDAQGGVGLENIKRRLELIYPGRHDLKIEESPQHFTVNLQIAL